MILRTLIERYRENRTTFIVWSILQALVVAIMIRNILAGDLHIAFTCLLTLLLFLIPPFIKHSFRVSIPTFLEVLILAFIFSAEILGEVNHYYIAIPYWDTLLHTLNGFAAAGIGLSLLIMADEGSAKLKLTAGFTALMAFCFSMTVGVVWEFGEYFVDSNLGKDSQKDSLVHYVNTVTLDETKTNKVIYIPDIEKTVLYNSEGDELAEFDGYLDIGLHDTMSDLLVNMVGAATFCTFGYFYIKHGKMKFLDNLLIKKAPKELLQKPKKK